MITHFKIFERFDIDVKVKDYVLIASDDSGIDPDNNIGVWGDPAIVVGYEKNNFGEDGFTITAHILTQNRTLSAYDYEIARKITRDEANMMVKKKHKFAVGEVVKKGNYYKFFTIHFVKFNKDLKLEYYLRDDQNLDKNMNPVSKFNGNYGWLVEDEIRKLTKEEQEIYDIEQQTNKYNL